VNNKIARLSPTFGFKNLQWMIKELLPFSLTMAIWVLYNYTDTIMLGYFKGAQQVGEYGAIYQLFEGMIVIPSILGAVFLPWMSYEFKKGFIGVERALQQGARLLIASSVPVVCVSLLASTELLHLIFGTEYVGAALGLSMLLGSAPFVFLFWFLRQGLIAIKKVKTLLIISSIGVIFNIIGNLIVIPPYGLYGACATTLATEFLTFIAALYVLHLNGIRGPGLMPWIQSISAGVAIVGPMIIIEYILGWAILGLPIGLVLAHLALCRTKFWTDNERKRLRTLHLAW
jgi:O-antigen/teichoic acid export membrane protein